MYYLTQHRLKKMQGYNYHPSAFNKVNQLTIWLTDYFSQLITAVTNSLQQLYIQCVISEHVPTQNSKQVIVLNVIMSSKTEELCLVQHLQLHIALLQHGPGDTLDVLPAIYSLGSTTHPYGYWNTTKYCLIHGACIYIPA